MKHKRWLLLCLAWVLCVGALCSCAGTRAINELRLKAMFTHNQLVLPISSPEANPGGWGLESTCGFTNFRTNLTLEEIERIALETDGSLTTRIIGNSLFLSKNNELGTKDYYYIHHAERERKWYEKKWYGAVFHGMLCSVFQSETERIGMRLLFPYHFMAEEALTYVPHMDFVGDTPYEIVGTPEEFYNFYKDSGWYDVTREENGFVLNGYRVDIPEEEKAESDAPYESIYFDNKLRFEFFNQDGKEYLSMSFLF